MTRAEFSKRVRLEAFTRANGNCEKCGAKLYPGKFQFDHDRAAGLGGAATLENCVVLCTNCHLGKTTTEDRPRMAKADRQRAAFLGLKPKSGRPIRSRGFTKGR